MSKLQDTILSITPLDEDIMGKTQEHLDDLTKPLGSLGKMEKIAKQIAGITGKVIPDLPQKAAILMAADHGVVAEGVSAYPQEVTVQMLMNFVSGGAAMNVLLRQNHGRLYIVDIGVAGEIPKTDAIIDKRIRNGSGNIAKEAAMTREEAEKALTVGIEMVEEAVKDGVGILAIGEMGIGNTTPASALIAFYSGLAVEDVTGRGTGVDDARLNKKIAVIKEALAFNQPDRNDPLGVLAKIGGLEIAGLAGVVLGAAANHLPLITDGFISTAASLCAVELAPLAKNYLIGSHLSQEPGHKALLDYLGLEPMLNMDMRLGEGTGAALAMNIVDSSLLIMQEMATFSSAGISEKE